MIRTITILAVTMLLSISAFASDIWVDVPKQTMTVPVWMDNTTPPRTDQLLEHGFRYWDQYDPPISDTNLFERLAPRVWIQDPTNSVRCLATFADTLISVRTNLEWIAATNAAYQQLIRRQTPAVICDAPPVYLDLGTNYNTLLNIVTNNPVWTNIDTQLYFDWPQHYTEYTNDLAAYDAKYIIATNAVRLATTTALCKAAMEKIMDMSTKQRMIDQDLRALAGDLKSALRKLVRQLKKEEGE